jgi:hypothetical protein
MVDVRVACCASCTWKTSLKTGLATNTSQTVRTITTKVRIAMTKVNQYILLDKAIISLESAAEDSSNFRIASTIGLEVRWASSHAIHIPPRELNVTASTLFNVITTELRGVRKIQAHRRRG